MATCGKKCHFHFFKMSNFAASMEQTFIGATLGSMVSQAAVRGLNGASGSLDFVDTLLGGLQTGTAFIAYPVACDYLKKHCPQFRKNFEDPKGCKIAVYVQGGMLGAGICTLMNYPLSTIQKNRKGAEKTPISLKGAVGFYVDQVGSSVGFAATMGTLNPIVPTSKNSVLAWARQHLLVNVSNVGGKCVAFPIHYLRHGSSLTGMIGHYLQGVPGVIITGDATAHFKNVLGFMVQ
ncbi:hypothetical protein TRFO_21306 [Tritrichomonas foetus]|uniref:Mitochondrial carrier protein n=1 Tax=Tritrichomonas foetus TaxID=1144522 RepID=A0A1J4KE38_9EUKA|nr:hypothetical protein TRFO_21306 [Tritrichomonas foetus]|eukprot:OHT09689.1 hypothetical protein TRFO_21306 [Tritrichomonas foetus]